MRPFACERCGGTVFFENTACVRCGAALGYDPGARRMRAFDPPAGLRCCANRAMGVCNWLVGDGVGEAAGPAGAGAGAAETLCRCCRLTEVVPALHDPANLARWRAVEQAKRRAWVTLDRLGLAPRPRQAGVVGDRGLSVRILMPQPGEPVTTGHDQGVVTLNAAEADDDAREQVRVALGEPVRTLLGHLRHELAHYLQWAWLADDDAAMASCRAVFGDERQDYAAALARHYAEGAPADWPQRFVSAYASAHPWEDWAETCAHLLLIVDAVDTAGAWGLRLDGAAAAAAPGADEPSALPIDTLVLEHWLPTSLFLNAMARSLGQRDPYPFLLSPAVLAKLGTAQRLLAAAAAQREASATVGADAAAPAVA